MIPKAAVNVQLICKGEDVIQLHYECNVDIDDLRLLGEALLEAADAYAQLDSQQG
jgi:hypothetical protein